MSVIRYAFSALAGLFLASAAFAQQPNIALGEWRSHLPNFKAKTLTKAGERIYCGTNGGFFYYDLEDNSINTLSKIEGFSDVGVQFISHDAVSGITLVSYQNTNIDLINPNGDIYNLTDIFRKTIIGVKQIRSVSFHEKMAYLSTTFGVVVIDLVNREVKDTYTNLGPAGRVLDVFATTVLNDSIYLSAKDNNVPIIQAAPIKKTNPDNSITFFNLLDFNTWARVDSGLPTANTIPTLAAYNNKVYAGVNGAGIYYYNGQTWQQTAYANSGQEYYLMEPGANALTVATRWHIAEISSPANFTITDNNLIELPKDAHRISENEIWVADEVNGLLRISGGQTEQIIPNGPYAIDAFDMSAENGVVVVAGGGYSPSYTGTGSRNGIYIFSDGQWTNYNPVEITDQAQYPNVTDVVEVAQDPNSGSIYFSPYGYGVVKWDGPGQYQIFNDNNSPLVNIYPGDNYVRVGGLAFDNSGALWVTTRNEKNGGSGPSLFEYKNGVWKSYALGNFFQSGYVEKLVVDDFGQKWIILSKNTSAGLLVYNSETNKYLHLTTSSNSRLPGAQVNNIVKDLNGAIWVATINGVAAYSSPSQIMNPGYNIDPRPRIDTRYLLEDQNVLDIAVDGGNRKWIGTDNGLWLFNESGTEMLLHFTTQNSPLPSNKVTKLTINQQTGEVFIGTDAGMVSYRTGATISEIDNSCGGVFPNPVRPGFTGMVGISGVPENANVKITDLAGTLVYEVQANGNTATWNLRDYNGRRVQAGVYLLMSASSDGLQQYMCKVAVLD